MRLGTAPFFSQIIDSLLPNIALFGETGGYLVESGFLIWFSHPRCSIVARPCYNDGLTGPARVLINGKIRFLRHFFLYKSKCMSLFVMFHHPSKCNHAVWSATDCTASESLYSEFLAIVCSFVFRFRCLLARKHLKPSRWFQSVDAGQIVLCTIPGRIVRVHIELMAGSGNGQKAAHILNLRSDVVSGGFYRFVALFDCFCIQYDR